MLARLTEAEIQKIVEARRTEGAKVPPAYLLDVATLTRIQELVRADNRCGSLETHDGYPCPRRPAVGYTVCQIHGGSDVAVAKHEAERLLATGRIHAVRWMLTEIEQAMKDPCPECGYPRNSAKDKKRLDALATKILDRTGLGPKATLTIEAQQKADDLDLSTLLAEELVMFDELMQALDKLRERVLARRAHEAANTIDALGSTVIEPVALPAPATEGAPSASDDPAVY